MASLVAVIAYHTAYNVPYAYDMHRNVSRQLSGIVVVIIYSFKLKSAFGTSVVLPFVAK